MKINIIENNEQICYAILKENIVKEFYVIPNKRYISYGKTLLTKCLQYAKKNNFDSLIVPNFDNALYNLLKKEGFNIENNRLVYSGLLDEKQQESTIFYTSIFSFILNLVLALLKIVIGFFFGFFSIIADGINSSSDCITNLLVVIGFKISTSPEDKKRPFGYGKIESIFSLLIATIMLLSSLSAILESIKVYISNKTDSLITNNYLLFFFTFLFILLKIFQYIFVRQVAYKFNNALLKTLIKDYLSDILVSTSVFFTTLLAIYISKKIDLVVSTLINIYIIYQAINLLYEHSLILIDTQNKNILNEVKATLLENEKIKYVHDLYMIQSGKHIYIYADVRVDKNLTVEISHELAEKVSLDVRKRNNDIKRVTLHIEPIY